MVLIWINGKLYIRDSGRILEESITLDKACEIYGPVRVFTGR